MREALIEEPLRGSFTSAPAFSGRCFVDRASKYSASKRIDQLIQLVEKYLHLPLLVTAVRALAQGADGVAVVARLPECSINPKKENENLMTAFALPISWVDGAL